jgi:thioredoxin reductase (NADPH)
MPTEKIYDVIIVGGGPAGLAAGLYCERAAMKTVLLEKGLLGGQIAISKEVENYPGLQGITGFDLAEKLIHHAQSFGLSVIQQEVSSVSVGTKFHSVRLSNGETLTAVVLILAVGGSVKKLGIPGEAEYFGIGVSYCATCDGYFFRNKTVVVVGGGDTAVEEALYLSKLTSKVYLIHRGNTLRASKLLQNRLHGEPKIDIIRNTIISEIKGIGRELNAVSFKNTETGETEDLKTDGVFIFIGYIPNNQLIPPVVRMNDRGFVITDDKCSTNVPGIFAVGDLRQKFANQILIAAADGCIAALAAAQYVEENKNGSIRSDST